MPSYSRNITGSQQQQQHRRIQVLSQQITPKNCHSLIRSENTANRIVTTTTTTTTTTTIHNNNQQMSSSNTNNNAVRVLVTGAAGQIAYSLLPKIASGEMFGPNQKVILHLLEIKPAEEALKGVVMELHDSAYPLLDGIVATVDEKQAFQNIDYAIFVGAFPRKAGMERKDLLQKNAGIFKSQAKYLDQYAKKTVKVLVVGNPANTNCLILKENAKSIPAENFTALTRLDHNRAKSQLALRLNVGVSQIHNVTIWGNHSSTQYPDVNHAYVEYRSGEKTPIRKAVNDDSYLDNEFITTVQKRGAAVIQARKLSSATSAAKAICDHMRNWILGTPEGEVVSMAIPSDGSYGIQPGVIYSYPVKCSQGKYQIVQGLQVNEKSRQLMQTSEKELREERQHALGE